MNRTGKIVLLSLFAVLQWTHLAYAFYSHSNWVEHGNNTQINDYLLRDSGKTGGVLLAGELPPKPIAAVAAACQPKSDGRSEILDLSNYPTSGFLLRGSVCDVSTAHPGRCVHGCTGPLCEQAPDSTCPGMNKDTPDELGGHAQGRHQTAAALAINATTEFVTQIISEVQSQQDQALCAMMGSPACASPLPIVPGLIGFGVETPAGSGPNRSGGKIIHVTNLNNSGSGSLRAALQASGPRIVVFDVSGYIEVQSRLQVKEPFLTIAGQTAPFPGITVKGAGIEITTHDVLVQHIRIRVGDDPNGPNPQTRDAITIWDKNNENDVYKLVIDHVSLSWAIDENINISDAGTRDISVTNSIISEALWHSIHPKGPHSKAFLVGTGTRQLLVSGNLLAHNDQRSMRVQGDSSTLFVNNVIYNWRGSGGAPAAGVYSGTEGTMDASIVGNVYIRGLDTRPGNQSIPLYIGSDTLSGSRIYIDDNEAIEKSNDPWSVVRSSAPNSIKTGTPPSWPASLTAKKSNVVKNWVLNNAGARRADGEAVDLRVINSVLNGTGRIIDSQNDVGGWPPLANNVRGTGGIPALSIPSNQIQPSGYTKVEEWLHLLAKQVEVPRP